MNLVQRWLLGLGSPNVLCTLVAGGSGPGAAPGSLGGRWCEVETHGQVPPLPPAFSVTWAHHFPPLDNGALVPVPGSRGRGLKPASFLTSGLPEVSHSVFPAREVPLHLPQSTALLKASSAVASPPRPAPHDADSPLALAACWAPGHPLSASPGGVGMGSWRGEAPLPSLGACPVPWGGKGQQRQELCAVG